MVPPFAVRGARTALAEPLAAAGLGVAAATYGRWSSNERAMRNRQALPHTTVLPAVTMSVSAISIEAMVLVLTRPAMTAPIRACSGATRAGSLPKL